MSRQQWGHGYHAGMNEKKKTGYVGLFFYDFKDGYVNHQGHILRRLSKEEYLAEYFSWVTGEPNGTFRIKIEDEMIFFETDLEMRRDLPRLVRQGKYYLGGDECESVERERVAGNFERSLDFELRMKQEGRR